MADPGQVSCELNQTEQRQQCHQQPAPSSQTQLPQPVRPVNNSPNYQPITLLPFHHTSLHYVTFTLDSCKFTSYYLIQVVLYLTTLFPTDFSHSSPSCYVQSVFANDSLLLYSYSLNVLNALSN